VISIYPAIEANVLQSEGEENRRDKRTERKMKEESSDMK
jgi:hypothetical protein